MKHLVVGLIYALCTLCCYAEIELCYYPDTVADGISVRLTSRIRQVLIEKHGKIWFYDNILKCDKPNLTKVFFGNMNLIIFLTDGNVNIEGDEFIYEIRSIIDSLANEKYTVFSSCKMPHKPDSLHVIDSIRVKSDSIMHLNAIDYFIGVDWTLAHEYKKWKKIKVAERINLLGATILLNCLFDNSFLEFVKSKDSDEIVSILSDYQQIIDMRQDQRDELLDLLCEYDNLVLSCPEPNIYYKMPFTYSKPEGSVTKWKKTRSVIYPPN